MNDVFWLLVSVLPIAAFLYGLRKGEDTERDSNRQFTLDREIEVAKDEQSRMFNARLRWVTHKYTANRLP